MYDSESLAKALLEFALETLEDANSASSPSDTQLKTLDAIFLVLERQLHRNGKEALVSGFMLTDLFGAQLELAKDDPQKLEQMLRESAAAVKYGLKLVGG